LKMRGPQ